MNILSLFDGMSCGMIAAERAGLKVDKYYASEIDKYAQIVSAVNYPQIIRMGDVTKWREWDIDWSSIDLLIGGSPCQGFSFAGKQLAFDDPRSKLFFVYVDILNHIKSLNPKVKFLLENVKMKKEYLNVISEMLGVEPIFINSALVSAQNRQRYYWCNWSAPQPEDKGIILADILETEGVGVLKDRGSWRVKGDKSNCITASYWKVVDNHAQRTMVSKSQTILSTIHKENVKSMIKRNKKGLYVFDGDAHRKLTPIECERLQTVLQYSKLVEISLCLDQAKNFVNAVEKNHKLLKLVLSAESEELKEYAKLAELNTRAKKAQIKSIVQQNADIQTQSQIEKCMLINQTDQNSHAGNAASITTYKQAGIEVDFVAHCAFMNITEGKTIHFGKEVLHQKDQNYTQLSNGKIALSLCGSEMLHNAKDALSALEIMQTNHHFTSITSSHLNTKNLEQILIISYWFAKSVIDGFTQDTINKRILYLNLIDGYTNHVSNTQRYKMLGNGWTVDVIAHIFSCMEKE